LLVAAFLLVVLPLLGVAGIAGMFWYYGRDLQEIDQAALLDHRPPQVTRIYARDGETLIGEIYTQRRSTIAYESIPSHVEDAFLAAEDSDFYHHEGLDYVGILRALMANAKAGEIKQGASTITQQVVKNFILSPERTFERKVQELLLARRLEQVLTKQEILELYLNEIYLGHGRYGIEEASRFYFGESVTQIDLGQAALLATLPKAPGAMTPLKDPVGAKSRQVYVLRQMADKGFASPSEAKKFIDAPLELADDEAHARTRVRGGAEEFVDEVRTRLRERYGDELDTLGAEVVTTVDIELQRAAREGLRDGLVALDRRQRYGHGIKPARDKNLARAMKKGSGPLKAGEVYPVVIVKAVEVGDDTPWPSDGFVAKIGDTKTFVEVPAGSRYREADTALETQFPAGGITMGRVLAVPGQGDAAKLPEGMALAEIGSGPQATVVLADRRSGEVLALVGGYDYELGDFNRALDAKRQPGSAFKPFVYGAALASRNFTASSLISDSPEIYEKWRPTNYERDVYRGDIRMRVALTNSVNTVAIKLLDATGIEQVHAFAKKAGIESELAPNLSIALGTSEVTPYELMRAYLTLARGGERIEPTLIREVRVGKRVVWAPKREPESAIEDAVAFVVTSLMTSVVQDGTGRGAKKLGVPVAGKTGTSAEARDAWFAGFTTEFVAVAWVGFDTPKPVGRKESGGRAALPIWLAAMKAANAQRPGKGFLPPPSVTVRKIDVTTGQLAALDAPPQSTLDEYFIEGTEPTEVAVPDAPVAEDLLLGLYGDAPAEEGANEEADDVEPSPTADGAGPGADAADPPAQPAPSAPKPADDLLGNLPTVDD